MKKNTWFIIVYLLGLACIQYGCQSAQSKTQTKLEEARKAIAESNAVYFQAFVKGDSSIFIERYADECCILAPNSQPLCGAQGALDFFRIAYHQLKLRNGKFITTKIYGMGNEYVTEEGLWQSYNANNALMDDGKFLVLWKKTSKGWKMYRDSFSSNHDNSTK
ncbi:YybH family protein [Xanthocytophaga flava]|uniref:YybH family protein n=1 Tax=Xanthocytophaga flava TaxID=3048013 RepID=UPI0028D78FA5|nr:nuclear transport factor 2 family protein [Xanthocytophaga flavus]MDJ1467016.1 nuclear transport factor 2 family protein [Xanthocytophaga flavus]